MTTENEYPASQFHLIYRQSLVKVRAKHRPSLNGCELPSRAGCVKI